MVGGARKSIKNSLMLPHICARRYWEYSYDAPKELSMASAPDWIASHYVSPQNMLAFDALNRLGCEGAGQQPWDGTFMADGGEQDSE